MRTKIYLSLILFSTFLLSCSKDEALEQFSTLGADQDKQNIENAGTKLTEELQEMSRVPFATIGKELVSYMNDIGSSQQNVIYSIALLGEAMADNTPIQSQFDLLMSLSTSNCNKLNTLWQQGLGIWEWNHDTKEFEQASTEGEDIILKFPASSNTVTNNTLLRIYDFESYDGNFPGKGEELENGTIMEAMLKSLYFELKTDGQLIASSNIIFVFSGSGNIENMNLTFNPIPYSFQAELNYRNNEMNWRYSFSNDTQTVFEQSVSCLIDEPDNESIIVKEINSSLQIINIMMTSKVKAVELLESINALKKQNLTEKEMATATAKAVNNYADLTIRYANNAIIAKGKATAQFNNNTTWIVDLLFEFSDNSTEYADDILHQMYIFESDLDLILKKSENKLN